MAQLKKNYFIVKVCPRVQVVSAWGKPVTSIYCHGKEWVELYLHYLNMPLWYVYCYFTFILFFL